MSDPLPRVLIAGAGPCGLALALALGRQGIAVTLQDASPDPWPLFRGEALMPSGLEALAALDLLPLPADVPSLPLRGWAFWLEGKPWFRVEEPMGATSPCTLVDPQALLRSMARRLESMEQVALQLGDGVSGLIEREGRIRGAALASGAQLQADLVVACDGRGSALRRAAGLDLQQLERPIDVLWFQLVDPAARELSALLAGRFHTVLGEGGSLALFPSARGGVQLGWPLRPGERPLLERGAWRQRWQALCPAPLARALGQVPLQAIRGPQRLPVQVGLAQPWWRPGLLLLGDAAHPLSPVRAQGTAMGLRDALVAAELLAPALRLPTPDERHHAIDRALAAIEARRRPELRRIQQLQQREWQRGEQLAGNAGLRRLLALSAPGTAWLLAAYWQRSQTLLRQGLPHCGPTGAVMMAPSSQP